MRTLAILAACVCLSAVLSAAEPAVMSGMPSGNLLVGGSGRVMILKPDGSVLWEHKTGPVHDVWRLPNGNILFADSAVTEVTPDHKVVFEYKAEMAKGGGVYGCQRLANGNTLIAENSTGRILEVDPQGKPVFTLQLPDMKPGSHNNLRIARKLANGNYLVCEKEAKRVREYKPSGEVVLEIKLDNIAFAAARLPNGNTLVSSIDHITEYDPAGKTVWDFARTDIPGTTITNMTGFHLLANGNLAIGCYGAYDKKTGAGVGLFEISRDKKLVWSYARPKADGSLMGIQVLGADGTVSKGGDTR